MSLVVVEAHAMKQLLEAAAMAQGAAARAQGVTGKVVEVVMAQGAAARAQGVTGKVVEVVMAQEKMGQVEEVEVARA